VINAIRAHLAEFGIIAPVGRQPQISQCALEQANKISARRWHVPKLELVTVLSGLFATNRIRLAHNLPNLEVLRPRRKPFCTFTERLVEVPSAPPLANTTIP